MVAIGTEQRMVMQNPPGDVVRCFRRPEAPQYHGAPRRPSDCHNLYIEQFGEARSDDGCPHAITGSLEKHSLVAKQTEADRPERRVTNVERLDLEGLDALEGYGLELTNDNLAFNLV